VFSGGGGNVPCCMPGRSYGRRRLRNESGSLSDNRMVTSSGVAGFSAGYTCAWVAIRGVLFGALSLVASLGCGEDLPVVAQGQYVEIATDRDSPVCAGTAAHLDRVIEHVFATLGETPPDRVFLRYEWLADPDSGAFASDQGDRIVVRSPLLVHEHELVHVAHLQAWPRSARFMEEGLAVMLDPHGRYQPILMVHMSRSTLDEILGDRVLKGGRYAAAWFIVSQIVHDHGFEGLRELWHRIPARASTQQVRDAYLEVFGRPIDELIEPLVYEGPNGPVYGNRVTCSYAVCAGEPRAWEGDQWIGSAPIGCEDDPNAVGPDAQLFFNDVGPVWRDYVLENTTPILPPRFSDGVTAIVASCGLHCPYSRAFYVGPDQLSTDWGGLLRVEVRTPLEALPIDPPGTFELQHYHHDED
jgi:hypothetical protein